MNTFIRLSIVPALICCVLISRGQESNDPKTLVQEGITLNDTGRYDDAIAKYKRAMHIDTNYANAYYEISYTLFSAGREKEAIPYLDISIKLEPNSAQGYDLLGSIYDDDKQPDKAIDYFNKAMAADSTYQRAYFNAGITYYRLGRYAESEQNAIKAIQLMPKHASSHRLYAMAAYQQKKDVPALMGFCAFLLLEPQTKRSAYAYQFIQKIFQSRYQTGPDSAGKKNITIYVSPSRGADSIESAYETFFGFIAASPTLDENKNKTPMAILTEELTSIFTEGGELAGKNTVNGFFWKFYVPYFYKLAQSKNMFAFTRLISLSGSQDQNLKWFEDNPDKLKALEDWMANNQLGN